MSGIMNKIGEALHVGGDHKKEEEKHKGEAHHDAGHGHGEHKGDAAHGHDKGEHKEGIIEKIKDKIHGDGSKEHGHDGEKEKKKKKEKKKHEDGHESSSSSDSD
ncbi:germin-like protein subfamily 1 member 7-like precursor [Hibiscus syriacus]|uniref:Germin-like protein subfamily 1 member 7-like n=1 Tax=Hibiscus syriacus TaxID=106335 RepID=A0A6A2YJY3_HIBSY|nr:dehydrin HIRD11-like [Hibiscus syriacus]XP_039030483.1 dehydrin HIRD11-like [Hibiscus syriacus]XP_039030484.1 dehydrin HIRD11-like [Hibiscus syriacus]KAE8677004.1 germin-like protein subfamily 1 member 7-like precursor [Hibiscus syriacus]